MKQKSSLLKALGIMLLFVLFATQARAQGITVTGTVNDNLGSCYRCIRSGKRNRQWFCITDLDGNFKLINVPSKGILVVSFVGYADTREIAVNNQTKTHYINLKEDAQQLDEAVVVVIDGYGDVSRDLTVLLVRPIWMT